MIIGVIGNFDPKEIFAERHARWLEENTMFTVNRYDINHAFSMRQELKRSHDDIYHVHYCGTNLVMALNAGVAPIIGTIHGSEIRLKPVRMMLKKIEQVTTDSFVIAERLAKEKIDAKVIRFGLDLELWTDPGLDRTPTVISMRNHDPIYDIGTLLRAAYRVRKQEPAIDFKIFGEGSRTYNLVDTNKRLARKHNMDPDKVQFMKWRPQHEIMDACQTSLICVSTSRADAGLASSTAEAMACGCIPVVSDTAENWRYIPAVQRFKVEDDEWLAKIILDIYRSKEWQKKARAEGKEMVSRCFDQTISMHEMVNLYVEVKERWQKKQKNQLKT